MVREITEEDLDTGTLIDTDEFVGKCIEGEVDDSDGYGYLVIDNMMDDKRPIAPSDYDAIGDDVTHILWYEV